MKSYFILTQEGKITRSIPQLPIDQDRIDMVNNPNFQPQLNQAEKLSLFLGGIRGVEVVKVNWDTNAVLHYVIVLS